MESGFNLQTVSRQCLNKGNMHFRNILIEYTSPLWWKVKLSYSVLNIFVNLKCFSMLIFVKYLFSVFFSGNLILFSLFLLPKSSITSKNCTNYTNLSETACEFVRACIWNGQNLNVDMSGARWGFFKRYLWVFQKVNMKFENVARYFFKSFSRLKVNTHDIAGLNL